MKILFIILLSISLYAAETKNEFDFSGKTSSIFSDVHTHDYATGSSSEQIAMQTLQLNFDYNIDNFHFQATPFAYGYHTNSGDNIKYRNWSKEFDTTDVWFRSLYATYTVGNWSVGAGVLPFSNSSPTKFNDDYIEDGEGVLLINDSVLTSVFVLYKVGNSRTIFGAGTPDHILVDTGNYIDEALREDSYSIFLINTYEVGKWKIVSEYLFNDIRYKTKKLAEDTLLGMTVSWDDSEKSGWSLYGTIAGSQWKGTANNAKEEIFNTYFSDNPYGMSGLDYGNLVMASKPENFSMDDHTSYGAAHMIGIRKDFEIAKQEFFINGEWTHTYNDYISGNQGTFYLGKNNQQYNIRDNSYYLQLGWIAHENLRVRLSYEHVELDGAGTIGNPGITIPHSESIIPSKIDAIKTTTLMVTYKF